RAGRAAAVDLDNRALDGDARGADVHEAAGALDCQLGAGLDDDLGASLQVNLGAGFEGVLDADLFLLIAADRERLPAVDFLLAGAGYVKLKVGLDGLGLVVLDGDVLPAADGDHLRAANNEVVGAADRLLLDLFDDEVEVASVLGLALADGEEHVALDLFDVV